MQNRPPIRFYNLTLEHEIAIWDFTPVNINKISQSCIYQAIRFASRVLKCPSTVPSMSVVYPELLPKSTYNVPTNATHVSDRIHSHIVDR
jgi:hypothetical protein